MDVWEFRGLGYFVGTTTKVLLLLFMELGQKKVMYRQEGYKWFPISFGVRLNFLDKERFDVSIILQVSCIGGLPPFVQETFFSFIRR